MAEQTLNNNIAKNVGNNQESLEAVYREIDRLVVEHSDELVTIRRHIHANPELSNREQKTAALVAAHLRSLGLDEVRTGITGHGVIGVLRGGLTGGAQAMLEAGALADPKPTMVFGMHVGPLPKGTVGYRVGNQYAASCLFKIVVIGVQVHGSTPWMGVDPMPAAVDHLAGMLTAKT